MPPTATPLYLDWQFWSAIVAIIAVVLSQLPPIRLWFRRAQLEVEVHSRVQLTHKVGNPNLGMYVGIRNIGGRNVRVLSIAASIARDGKVLGTYPVFSYFETPSSTSPVLFVPFTLKPAESWAHGTNFLQVFDRATEKFYRESESALRSDIRRKLADRPEDQKDLVEADERLVKPFLDMFNRMFVWHPGEYTLDLTIQSEAATSAFGRRYRFTLFESDAAELISHTEDYKHGGGLSYNVDRHAGVFVPLTAGDA